MSSPRSNTSDRNISSDKKSDSQSNLNRRSYLKLSALAVSTAAASGTGVANAESSGYSEDGYGEGGYGGTDSDSNVIVSTHSPTSVGEQTATLAGSLDDLGGTSSVDCYFEWREAGASSWNATSLQNLSSTGDFSEDIGGLSSTTDYEYRAVANSSDSDTGSTVSFTTESGSSKPVVDTFAVSERGSPNPHAEITVDWTVSDSDGDLDRVVVDVFNADGTKVESSVSDVSGASASSSEEFTIKHGGGETYDIALRVTDETGSITTRTESVQA